MILPGLTLTNNDLRIEHAQLLDEGRDISAEIEAEFKELGKLDMNIDPSSQTRAQALLDMAEGLPARADYPYHEPSDLGGIRAARPRGRAASSRALEGKALDDHLLGAWLGRCSGCLLGKPVEGWLSSTMWPYLKALGRYPLADYFRSDAPDAIMEAYHIPRERAYIDRVPHMVEDDDTNYTMTGLAIMEQCGPQFMPEDVARFWLENIPIFHTFTAERVAYRNLTNLIPPPESAAFRNPYREWIGAQIRGDFWGFVAVGNPELAAEFAWRDASISHVKNGIYGEMWVAAMLASAPFMKDPREVITAGLSEIPGESRLAEAIHEVLGWYDEGIAYGEAIRRIHEKWDETWGHHWCHTISNAQIVAMGLMWGENDFEKSICRAVEACFDTDCNGATVGSIFGMLHGAQSLPEKWTGPLNDGLETGLAGYHFVKISEMAKKTASLHQRVAGTGL
jgi:hypothetical protein